MITPLFLNLNDCENCSEPCSMYNCRDCKCPKNNQQKKTRLIPKRHFSYRFAVPFSFVIKNYALITTTIFFIVFGFVLTIFSIFSISISTGYSLLMMSIGVFFCFFPYFFIFEKFFKQNHQCENKIYMKIYKLHTTKEDWKIKAKEYKIPNKYIMSKVREDWEYDI